MGDKGSKDKGKKEKQMGRPTGGGDEVSAFEVQQILSERREVVRELSARGCYT